MPKTATIQARIDAKTKSEAQRILSELDITLTQAIVVYLRQIIFNNGIPFALKIPNDDTAKALEESERGEGLDTVSSVDELFKELDA
jgi:DNA-damage-inducible protein J